MTDIVERLRAEAAEWRRALRPAVGESLGSAADEIMRLRNALREIAESGPQIPLDDNGEGPDWPMHIYAMKWASFSTKLQTIAIIALKETDRD